MGDGISLISPVLDSPAPSWIAEEENVLLRWNLVVYVFTHTHYNIYIIFCHYQFISSHVFWRIKLYANTENISTITYAKNYSQKSVELFVFIPISLYVGSVCLCSDDILSFSACPGSFYSNRAIEVTLATLAIVVLIIFVVVFYRKFLR